MACTWLWIALGALSFVGFAFAAADKRQARLGERRVPEQRLLLLALLGAWPGMWLAFVLVRHKTRKGRFLIPFAAAAVANGAAVLLLARQLDCFR